MKQIPALNDLDVSTKIQKETALRAQDLTYDDVNGSIPSFDTSPRVIDQVAPCIR